MGKQKSIEREKRNAIDTIDALYPIDSNHRGANEVGERLLMEVLREFNWRDLPLEVLMRWASKCEAEEGYLNKKIKDRW